MSHDDDSECIHDAINEITRGVDPDWRDPDMPIRRNTVNEPGSSEAQVDDSWNKFLSFCLSLTLGFLR